MRRSDQGVLIFTFDETDSSTGTPTASTAVISIAVMIFRRVFHVLVGCLRKSLRSSVTVVAVSRSGR